MLNSWESVIFIKCYSFPPLLTYLWSFVANELNSFPLSLHSTYDQNAPGLDIVLPTSDVHVCHEVRFLFDVFSMPTKLQSRTVFQYTLTPVCDKPSCRALLTYCRFALLFWPTVWLSYPRGF